MSALNIKYPVVAEMARRLAKLRGQSITDAVASALSESLKAADSDEDIRRAALNRRVDEIVESFRSKLDPDAPSLREIEAEMYDENGLPR